MQRSSDTETPAEPAPLEVGERVIASCRIDLDDRLRYAQGRLLLTDRRVLAGLPGGGSPGIAWSDWRLDQIRSVETADRGGLCRIDLVGDGSLLARFRHTLREAPRAREFAEAVRLTLLGRPPEPHVEPALCPRCGRELPETHVCAHCEVSGTLRQSARSLFRLEPFARRRIKPILAGFALSVASTIAGLLAIYVTKPLINNVLIPVQGGAGASIPFSSVYPYLLALAGASVLAWLLAWARSYLMAWVSERISADIRNTTFEHLQKLSLEYFGGKRTGDLIARLSNDTDRICNYLSVNLVDFASDLFLIAGAVVLLFSTDSRLATATLLPMPLVAWLVSRIRGEVRRTYQGSLRAWSELTSVLNDAVSGVRVVKAFAQEGREVERFHQGNRSLLAAADRVNRIWAFVGPFINFLSQSGVLVIWGYGAWRIFARELNFGELSVFITLMTRFYTRLEATSRIVQATQRAGASADRLFEILDRSPGVPEAEFPVPLVRMEGRITFDGVSFRHGNRLVLDNINLEIRPGEMIGLVGPSGAGKSTLVNLICRFYDTTEGTIRIDGVELNRLATSEYRRRIGLVLQEPYLFYGTVAENIAYGNPNASREEILAAARAARAHEFILRLPHGYDSLVGERGQALSGGERQRISIARALLINPRILIMDEATSAIDTATEILIQQAIGELVQGRTTIVIAHRLSTLHMADRLVVIEQGKLVEEGRHDDLMARNGVYARLYLAQTEYHDRPGEGSPLADGESDIERAYVPHVRELAES